MYTFLRGFRCVHVSCFCLFGAIQLVVVVGGGGELCQWSADEGKERGLLLTFYWRNAAVVISLVLFHLRTVLFIRLFLIRLWTVLFIRLVLISLWTVLFIRLVLISLWTVLLIRPVLISLWTVLLIRPVLVSLWTILLIRPVLISLWTVYLIWPVLISLWTVLFIRLVLISLWTVFIRLALISLWTVLFVSFWHYCCTVVGYNRWPCNFLLMCFAPFSLVSILLFWWENGAGYLKYAYQTNSKHICSGILLGMFPWTSGC